MEEKTTNLKKARRNPEKELPELFKRFLMRTHNMSRYIRALKSGKARYIASLLNDVPIDKLILDAFFWDKTKEGDKYWGSLHRAWGRYIRICEDGITIK